MGKKIYGKINHNSKISIIPKKLEIDGRFYYNPQGNICNDLGYFEIINTEYPTDGKVYKEHYDQRENYIFQSWVEISEEELKVNTKNEQEEAEKLEPDLMERINNLEARVAELEDEVEFLMDYGKFKIRWNEYKKNKKDLY